MRICTIRQRVLSQPARLSQNPSNVRQAEKRPYSELTRQPGRGILRAMDSAGTGAAKTGPSEPGNKGISAGLPGLES